MNKIYRFIFKKIYIMLNFNIIKIKKYFTKLTYKLISDMNLKRCDIVYI